MSKNSTGTQGNDTAEMQRILKTLEGEHTALSPAEVAELVHRLVDMRKGLKAKAREERRRREREEKRRRAEEEKAAREAHVAEVTSMDLPMDWENAFGGDPRAEGVHAESIPDGLILSLTTLGRVDIEYIAKITGEECKTVITALRGSIYQNPETWEESFLRGCETAEEYLSGNLIRKWRVAKEANKTYHGYFRENVKALEAALPPAVPSDKIYVTLGSPWVPTHVIDEFISHILQSRHRPVTGTRHDEETGTWELPDKEALYLRNGVAASHTYGTRRMSALYILEKTLNMRTISVVDEFPVPGPGNRVKHLVNREQTVLALEKQQLLISEFRRWVFADEKRKAELTEIYENKYGCVRRRIFDGSFLRFPGMTPDITLYPYQKNAVARILFSPNTLLAHDVGSGKTYIMIAAGMELRRMGLSKKNLYVVPNNLVGQWESIFRAMYPAAKLLSVTPAQFTPARRQAMLAEIRDGEFDGILMAYSCFERITVSRRYHEKELEETWQKLERIAADPKRATNSLRRKCSSLKREIATLAAAAAEGEDIPFDELGITRLFVDEAHNYKNVPIETKSDKVNGISSSGSKKCQDMLDKVHIVQRANEGGGVVMATGTPITNSITDAFVMQKYLQSGELALLDLQTFDSWIGMFAERVTEFEIDVDTSGYRLVTRFAKFHNLPELTAILSSIADFHRVGPSAGLPSFDGYTDCLIPRPRELSDYLADISHRAEMVRGGLVPMKEDNMLKITTDGRKAALDLRLVQDGAAFTERSKVARCARNVRDVYRIYNEERGTQLVFCDISTPRKEFNIYDDLRSRLIAEGIPEEEIAFVHDATSERTRARLFESVRRGDIRILIGSTFKLGIGVNVQDRLVAIHHLDVPWRPSDMTQREGRILRQGNENPQVYIYRYITEGSFDAYSWQILETKQRFITGLLSGSLTERSGSDVESTVLNYAEVKALAIGNPLVKQRVETANELARYLTLQRHAVEERLRLEGELLELPGRIAHMNETVAACRADCDFLKEEQEKIKREKSLSPDREEGSELALTPEEQEAASAVEEERAALRARLALALREHILSPEEDEVAEYRGFRLLLPSNMVEHRPFLFLVREGRYLVEFASTGGGLLEALDAVINNLPTHLAKLRENLRLLKARRTGIKAELAREDGYAARIEELSLLLKKIDKKLGVQS